MGVHNLWQILDQNNTSTTTPLDSLHGKRLAIDASIWLYQFLRVQTKSRSNNNAETTMHITGFFRRLCKLAYFGIKPVFVFDGQVTRLKKDTIKERRLRREKMRGELDEDDDQSLGGTGSKEKVARRLLAMELQRMKDDKQSARKNKDNKLNKNEEDEGNFDRFRSTSEFHLPPLQGFVYDESDSRINADNDYIGNDTAEYNQWDELEGINLTTIDPASSQFNALPLTTQYLVLSQLRLKSRLRMGYSKDQLEEIFPNSLEFSKFQIEMVKKRNYFTQRLMGISGMGGQLEVEGEDTQPGKRVSGVKGREYKLKKVDGGWALSLDDNQGDTAANPVDLTKDNAHKKKRKWEDDDDEDWEDVDLNVKAGSAKKTDWSIGNLPLPPKMNGVNASESTMRSFIISPSKNSSKANKPVGLWEDEAKQYEQAQLDTIDQEMLQEAIERSKTELLKDQTMENEQNQKMIENDEDEYDEFADFEDIPIGPESTTDTHAAPAPAPPLFSFVPQYSDGSTANPPPLLINGVSSSLFTDKPSTASPSRTDTAATKREVRQDPNTLFTTVSSDEDEEPLQRKPWHRDAFEVDEDKGVVKRKNGVVSKEGMLVRPRPKPANNNKTEHKALPGHEDKHDEEKTRIPSIPAWFDQQYVPLKNNKPEVNTFSVAKPSYSGSVAFSLQEKRKDEELGLVSYAEAKELMDEKRKGKSSGKDEFGLVEIVDLSDSGDEVEQHSETEEEQTGAEPEEIEETELDDEQEKETEAKDNYIYEFSEDEESELQTALFKESDSNATFLETLALQNSANPPKQSIQSFRDETQTMLDQTTKAQTQTTKVTPQITRQIQSLLTTFGIPYITAPTEAESQCSELYRLGLIDGIITDDSDVFLFGGDKVYRHFFAEKKYVVRYDMKRIENTMRLDRKKMTELAVLLGSDYTKGVKGVGPVLAMEILEKFYDLETFRDWFIQGILSQSHDEDKWLKSLRKRLTKLESLSQINEGFPDPEIIQAYLQPEVNSDPTEFKWGDLDLDRIREFMMTEAHWQREKCDDVLIPLIRDLNRKKAERAKNGMSGQRGIEDFYGRN